MSFPKAKIQRFNNVKDLTPSRANYNVNIQDKIKLGIISQSGAFPKKPTGSCSGSDNGSVHSTPCFQTPIVPKKKTFLGLSGFESKPAVDKEELLREKNVECYDEDSFIEDYTKQIEELIERISHLWEEHFKEVSSLIEMQTNEKIEEIEACWKAKLQQKKKESEAILKECQEISEKSEIEKNHFKNLLGEKEVLYEELNKKHAILEEENKRILEEITNIKIEKHAYEVSINTFKDTIEVLKKRLINSDRDMEELKEELTKSEEKIAELQVQLVEKEVANRELEKQYESMSKMRQDAIEFVEKNIWNKVKLLKEKLQEQRKDKDEVLPNYHEQQHLVVKAQERIQQSSALIESLESHQLELEEELSSVKVKLVEEAEEASQARKKYIDLEAENYKLREEIEELKLNCEDKENLGSPRCVKGVLSPGPLRDKN